jgi:hypothetical protein
MSNELGHYGSGNIFNMIYSRGYRCFNYLILRLIIDG